MRDKNFDVDLLKTLNDQPMPETPLTDDEFTRVLDAACGRQPGLSWLRKRDFSAVPAPLKDDRLRQEAISASLREEMYPERTEEDGPEQNPAPGR